MNACFVKICHLSYTLHLTAYNCLYTVSQKNILLFFDCNLKTNYQILIIFGMNIPDTTLHQMTFLVSQLPMYASTLPRESRSSEICVEINRKPEKNIPDIIDRNLKKD